MPTAVGTRRAPSLASSLWGASLTTDVLIAHAQAPVADEWSHHLISGTPAAELIATARRAAWTSLAFAFREAAAKKLDIDVQELETGLRFVRDATLGLLYPEIFLCDSIENGAGYVSHLAERDQFADLIERWVEPMIAGWEAPAHGCDTSCYVCLRDYTNNAYHPLLDWRLAADALEILRYGSPQRDRWARTRQQAANAAALAFDWRCEDPNAPMPRLEDTHGRPVDVVHPLANHDASAMNPFSDVLVCDVFNLNRRPGAVYLAV
jgi:hypothetical protein